MKPAETHRRPETIFEGKCRQTPESLIAIRDNLLERFLLQFETPM